MPAFVIANIRITDEARFERYKALSSAAVEAHGGRFIVRGGKTETVEGTWVPRRLTIIEFPSRQAADAFVRSAEYGAARDARRGAAFFDMVVADGL